MAERKYQNEARVYVDGKEIIDVYSCSYSIRTERARSGIPVKNAHPHRIRFTRRSTPEQPGFFWAYDSRPGNYRSGKIDFYNTKGEIMKTFEWDKGYVIYYREGVPDLTEAEEATMLEEFEIAAEVFRCGDATLEGYWSQ